MKKIPSILERDHSAPGRAPLTGRITPGTEWVFTDDGVIARRKWDGTAVRCIVTHDEDASLGRERVYAWYVRRAVKPNKIAPAGFLHAETDPATGLVFGWEPAAQSGFAKALDEAIGHLNRDGRPEDGTYELVGPKVGGNPERQPAHHLVRHDTALVLDAFYWRDRALDVAENLVRAAQVIDLRWRTLGHEGVVFYHPDGRRAKLKAKDAHEFLLAIRAGVADVHAQAVSA